MLLCVSVPSAEDHGAGSPTPGSLHVPVASVSEHTNPSHNGTGSLSTNSTTVNETTSVTSRGNGNYATPVVFLVFAEKTKWRTGNAMSQCWIQKR